MIGVKINKSKIIVLLTWMLLYIHVTLIRCAYYDIHVPLRSAGRKFVLFMYDVQNEAKNLKTFVKCKVDMVCEK